MTLSLSRRDERKAPGQRPPRPEEVFALDTQAYEDGALDKKTKELMGLVGSIVLRCDDCITYHIKECAGCGVTRDQFMDAFNVALVVGGSITIPHLRRAVERLDQVLGK